MNETMTEIGKVCNLILPMLLLVLLLVAIILLIRIIMVMNNLNKTLNKVNSSVDIINDYLEEMKLPVRAVVNISMSIEALRAATESGVKDFYERFSKAIKALSEFFNELWKNISQIKKDKTDSEPDSEEVSMVKIDPEEK